MGLVLVNTNPKAHNKLEDQRKPPNTIPLTKEKGSTYQELPNNYVLQQQNKLTPNP